MPGLRTRRSTPLFHLTQNDQYTQIPRNSRQTRSRPSPDDCPVRGERMRPTNEHSSTISGRRRERLADLPMFALSRGESMRPTNEHSSTISGKRRERLADAQGSVTPESMRPASTPPEGPSVAAHLRRHFAGGGITPLPPAFLPTPLPRTRQLSALPRPAPSAPGGQKSPPGATTSISAPPPFQNLYSRRRLSSPDFIQVLDSPSRVPLRRRDWRLHSVPRTCVETRVGISLAIKNMKSVSCRSVPRSHPQTPSPPITIYHMYHQHSRSGPPTCDTRLEPVYLHREVRKPTQWSSVNARWKAASSAAQMSHPSRRLAGWSSSLQAKGFSRKSSHLQKRRSTLQYRNGTTRA